MDGNLGTQIFGFEKDLAQEVCFSKIWGSKP